MTLHIVNGRHPVIEQSLSGDVFVRTIPSWNQRRTG